MENIKIRSAELSDAPRLSEIYRYYVENTAISFEYAAPSAAEFAARMENIMKKYPYLAAESDGVIVGYAYANAFHERAAYGWAAELTVYVDRNCRGSGCGRRLYEAMEKELKKMGVLNLYALVVYPEEEDEYLTKNSLNFHKHMGFAEIGHQHSCGQKFGRWYDMTVVEKLIGEHIPDAPAVISYPDLKLKFRPAEASDLDDVLEMLFAARRKLNSQGIKMWDETYPNKAVLENDLAKESLFVGTLGGKVAACYVINDDCDEDYVNGSWQYPDTRYRFGHRLCVDTRLQGRGLASQVMEHVEEQLRAEGVESFRFEASADNPVSLALYEKHGYKCVGEMHWDIGVFYLMEKLL